MKYVILVSHGNFAEGLLDSLKMLTGNHDNVIAIGLKDGITADQFAIDFTEIITKIPKESEIIVLADIIGGSPLSTAMNVLAQSGLIDKTTVLGGMNLPLALTTILMKDVLDTDALITNVTSEATGAIKQFVLETNDEDDDI